MAPSLSDPHFCRFKNVLEEARKPFLKSGEIPLAHQKRQITRLVSLEKSFRNSILKSVRSEEVFSGFVRFICEERRNILDARPYFRERQVVFSKQVSRALRRKDWRALTKMRFNFRFVQWVLKSFPWKERSQVVTLAKQISEVRQELVTMNMPLAISRARIFYSRTPKDHHLTYMDLIQIACEGLMSGIDKFCPPFSKAWRGVAIGRMTGNFIESSSATMLHFYPPDKRKIYRAKKALGRAVETVDFEALSKTVNQGFKPKHKTNASEISNLVAAASMVSMDTPLSPGEDEDLVRLSDRFAAPLDTQPDVAYEKKATLDSLKEALSVLTCFEQKLVRARGVDLL